MCRVEEIALKGLCVEANLIASSSSMSSADAAGHRHGLSELEYSHLIRLIDISLEEDVSTGDYTSLSTISSCSNSSAIFLAKAGGIISGISVAKIILNKIDKDIQFNFTLTDGAPVSAGTVFGTVDGPSRSLLIAERLILNLMQRMSGIATATNLMLQKIKAVNSRSKLLDTRKTVPGLRLLDKRAVRDGGGYNHRIGLYDMIMIKDNHIAACGGIKQAIIAVNDYLKQNNLNLPIEVETRTLDEVKEVLAIGRVDRIMLDNMVKLKRNNDNSIESIDCSMLERALDLINHKYETEASGNVTLDSVGEISRTNVDYISTGSITHSVIALDISMKIK
jgi:nicotinate-nucleotide pyrophosphorylase (carboxylating)